MLPVPDSQAALYLTCFLVGLLFIVVSAVLGLAHGVGHITGVHDGSGAGHAPTDGADFGHVGHADPGVAQDGSASGHSDGGKSSAGPSPLNLMTAMAFLTWFGAAGYILDALYGLALPLSLIGAAAAGLLAGWLVFLFLVKVLLPGTTPPDPKSFRIVGSLARVSMAIPDGGLGEVVYTLGGARHSDGARSLDGTAIGRDEEVVIVRYEKGIAQVEPWKRYLGSGETEADSG